MYLINAIVFADVSKRVMQSSQLKINKGFFASVNTQEDKPFDFFRTLFGLCIFCLLVHLQLLFYESHVLTHIQSLYLKSNFFFYC